MKKKVLFFVGTRPEAIKLAPLIKLLESSDHFEVRVCLTAQHRELLDNVIDFFEIRIDYDLNLMKANQSLHELTSSIILQSEPVIREFIPDFTIVQGDTTTAMACSLSSFYCNVKTCHVEAGLRTFNKLEPFPEEINRNIVSRIADYHFAPTELAKSNLVRENINEDQIFITGNTVIDSLFFTIDKLKGLTSTEIGALEAQIDHSKKMILVTGHRRENHLHGIRNICKVLNELAKDETLMIVWPVHPNPNVVHIVDNHLNKCDNILRTTPLQYEIFVWLMNKSYLILTDSGGIQEEAPSLGKPVLVTRNHTERIEAIEAGTVKLVGTDPEVLLTQIQRLVYNEEDRKKMIMEYNPYGDGKASYKILEILKSL